MPDPLAVTVVDVGSRLLVAWHGGTPIERDQMAADWRQTFTHRIACWRTADRCWSVSATARRPLEEFIAGHVSREHLTWVSLHGTAPPPYDTGSHYRGITHVGSVRDDASGTSRTTHERIRQ